jgi:PAS domain S-box-containing protein
MLLLDSHGRIIEANDAAMITYGYGQEILNSMTLADLSQGLDKMAMDQQTCCGLFEAIHFRSDGSSFPAELRFCELEQDEQKRIFVIVRNIADRKRLENKLLYLSYAIEQNPASVVITDTDGKIEYVNPKFCEVTGYSREEAIGQNPRILKSGEQPPEVYQELWATITAGGEWRGEFHNKKKNDELYWELASISAIRDIEGNITKFLAVKEDITERKETETALQQAEAQLRQELLLAAKIQRSFLPAGQSNHQVTIRTIYEPYTLVSGDIFDFFWLEGTTKLTGYIVDIMGHGVATALQASALRVLGRQVLQTASPLAERVSQLNRISSSCFTEDSFAAMMAFEFDFIHKTLTYVAAGINYFFACTPYRAGLIKTPGTFVGMLPEAEYEQHIMPFMTGDTFYFASDGLFELTDEAALNLKSYPETCEQLARIVCSQKRTDDATGLLIKIQ